MLGPEFSVDNFKSALLKLLPTGQAWPRDPDSLVALVMEAFAPTHARLAAAANALLEDSPPFALNQRLPEWEETLGLPDPCAGPNQTIQQRVGQVIAKLAFNGGQSPSYFIALAATIGYPNCIITEYAPFRADHSHAGDPAASASWAFAWQIFSPTLPIKYFTADHSYAGEGLYTLESGELQCTINKYAPAHTIPLYAGHT